MRAIPSPCEEHTGEVRSPAGHEVEIQVAFDTLTTFVADFNGGRLPFATVGQVSGAADLLWIYAGCPSEHVWSVMFFDSPEAAGSYRTVAREIPKFVAAMKGLIVDRLPQVPEPTEPKHIESTTASVNDGGARIDDDIPF